MIEGVDSQQGRPRYLNDSAADVAVSPRTQFNIENTVVQVSPGLIRADSLEMRPRHRHVFIHAPSPNVLPGLRQECLRGLEHHNHHRWLSFDILTDYIFLLSVNPHPSPSPSP